MPTVTTRRRAAALLALLLAPSGAPLPAQALTPALQGEVVDSAARVLESNFVDPEVGRRLARHLREGAASRQYAADTTPSAFALALGRRARGVTADLHFNVLSPEQAGRLGAPPTRGRADGDALRRRAARERRQNFFFRAYERLPGNVAYLALDQFAALDGARETAAAAMRLLANADAVILDLRRNRGGVEGLNQFLSSYFFDGRSPVVLYTRYDRVADTTAVYRVLPDVPGPRLPDVPLFLLVGGGTGSSAENMAYSLQARGRATVVGEPTAGAAHSSRVFALPGGFAMQVPVARVLDPVTRTNWEGRGVQPDVRTDAAAARDTAHARALRVLLAAARDEGERAELGAALAALGAPASGADDRAAPSPARPAAVPDTAGRLAVRRPATVSADPAPGARPPRNMGFGLVPRPDGTLTVTGVVAGSSAERAGLREGDVLVELDGTPATAMHPGVMRAAAARDGTTRVVVTRGGQRLVLDVAPHVEPSR